MLTSLGIIIVLAMLLARVCELAKLPRLLGMLICGVVLGPYVLDVLSGDLLAISAEIREIALVIILMRGGLSLSTGELKRIGRPAVLLSFLPATFEIIGYVIFARAIMGVSIVDSLLIGSVLAAVSPAVVVPRMLKIKAEGYGDTHDVPSLVVASSSVDDVYVIVLFTSFLALGSGEGFSAIALLQIPVSILLGIGMGVAVGIAVAKFFAKFDLSDVNRTILLLAISFLLLAVEDMLAGVVAVSGLLAIITMGVMLSSRVPEKIEGVGKKFAGLWSFFEILLFVLVGASVDINYATASALPILAVIFLSLIFRMVGAFLATANSMLTTKERVFVMLAFSPKATVQAAIGGVALSAGLAIGNTVLSFAVIGILVCAPVGAVLIDSTYRKLLEKSCLD